MQRREGGGMSAGDREREDRKSTRLNSSHDQISYAVFCLKKKKKSQGHRSPQKRSHRPPLGSGSGSVRRPSRPGGIWRLSRGRFRGRSFFFFNDTATTEIYTLSLHDALPI